MTAGGRIRALIIDDEPLARRKIRRMLARDPEVEILDDCANGREAIAAISTHNPDLVCLAVDRLRDLLRLREKTQRYGSPHSARNKQARRFTGGVVSHRG